MLCGCVKDTLANLAGKGSHRFDLIIEQRQSARLKEAMLCPIAADNGSTAASVVDCP